MSTKKTFTAQVVSARRITIPYEICLTEGISEGDFVDVQLVKVKKYEEVQAK